MQIENAFGDTIQRESLKEEEEEPLQDKFVIGTPAVSQKKPSINHTGFPDALKTGVENLSGVLLDDMRVQYNSSKPAELQALSYPQGTEIHLTFDTWR